MSRNMFSGNVRNAQAFSREIQISNEQLANLENSISSLQSNGLDNLGSSLGSIQGMFRSLGIEIGSMPQRLLSVATATTQLLNSTSKLKNLKLKERITKSFGKSWNKSGKQVADFDDKVQKLIQNIKTKITSMKANGLAMKGANVQTAAMIAKNKKLSISFATLKKQLTLKNVLLGIKKVAFTLLNVVKGVFIALWKLSPFGMIAGAVALAGAAIAGLVRLFNRSSDAAEEVRARNEAIAESIEEVSNRLDGNRQAHADNLRGIERTTAVNDQLINRLQDLNNVENLNAAERAQKIATIRELNDSIEGLNLVYCEETGLLDENSRLQFEQLGLRNDISEANSVAEAKQSRLNEALYDEAELLQKIENLDFAGQKEELAEKLANGSIRQREYNDLLEEMQVNYNALQYELRYTQNEIGYLETAWYDSLTNMTYLTSQYVTDQRLSWDSLNEHQQGVMNNLKSMITDYTDHAQNRMSTLSDEVTVSGRDMIDNMLENQRVLETWSDNIAILAARGIDEGLLEEMRQMGPEGAAQAAAMVAMCDDEFAEMNEVFARGTQVATDALATQLGEGFEEAVNMTSHFVNDARTTMVDEIAGADFESIGKSVPDGVARGVARSTEYINAMRELAEDGKNEYTSAIGYNSPSRVYMGYGEAIVKGLANGINNLKSKPLNNMQKLAQDMQRKYNNVNNVYSNIGRNIMSGLNQGLLSGESSVMATANRIANNIAATMRRALQINSPSRLMREQIGRQIPAGVADGIDKYSGYALDSVSDLGKELLKVNIPKMSDIIKFGPSLSYAGVGGAYGGNVTNVDRTNDNRGLFEGATINWHGKQDIRETMEEIAWEIQSQDARFI